MAIEIWLKSHEEPHDLHEVVSDLTLGVRPDWFDDGRDFNKLGECDWCLMRWRGEEDGEQIANQLKKSEAHALLTLIARRVAAIDVSSVCGTNADAKEESDG